MVPGQVRHRRNKAIAVALYARDVLVAKLTVAQRLAQRGQMDPKTAFLDRYLRPRPRDQGGLRDDLTGVFEKSHQDVVGSAPKRNDLVGLPERALGDIQIERAKPKPHCSRRANLLNQHELFR